MDKSAIVIGQSIACDKYIIEKSYQLFDYIGLLPLTNYVLYIQGVNDTNIHIIILYCIHVSRFTTKYVSPALQQAELETVGKTTSTHGNMEVSCTQ